MSNSTQALREFIVAAQKSRKYPDNTAGALKSALRLFETELTDEERESLDTFKDHLDQIYQSVYNKYKSKMSAASLQTYRRRIDVLLSDYEKYGIDPSKMASWNRESHIRRSNRTIKPAEKEADNTVVSGERSSEQGSKIIRFEISLRPDVKAIILTPSDMTLEEVEKIKGYVEFLAKCAAK